MTRQRRTTPSALGDMAAQHKCSIVAITHLNKGAAGKAAYRSMGSLAFVAAARIAWVELIDWMVSDYGLDRMKAYHLLGQVGQMRLGNMVDPKYTMVAKCPRRYLDRI